MQPKKDRTFSYITIVTLGFIIGGYYWAYNSSLTEFREAGKKNLEHSITEARKITNGPLKFMPYYQAARKYLSETASKE